MMNRQGSYTGVTVYKATERVPSAMVALLEWAASSPKNVWRLLRDPRLQRIIESRSTDISSHRRVVEYHSKGAQNRELDPREFGYL